MVAIRRNRALLGRRARTKLVASKRKTGRTYKSTYMNTGTNPNNHTVFLGKGFPDKLTTNVVFSDTFILAASAGTPTVAKSFLMTSGWDPQDALGGNQPTYWDQLALIYSRYTVNGAKMTAIFSRGTTTTADVGPYICGITQRDSAVIPSTNAGVLMSAPNTTFKVVTEQSGAVEVVATYSKKNVFPDFTDNLQARMNANPVINWFGNVFISPQGVDLTTPINIVVIIEYNCTFSDVVAVVDT